MEKLEKPITTDNQISYTHTNHTNTTPLTESISSPSSAMISDSTNHRSNMNSQIEKEK